MRDRGFGELTDMGLVLQIYRKDRTAATPQEASWARLEVRTMARCAEEIASGHYEEGAYTSQR